ncbi:hypothetical protein F53441_11615 [Fusarium austroafricanum]|uniref:Heterokaryon incompatibility domain-containing protein n=1 Tax=Fusarium austroafricanum TaxID=2364996 RepID=A0A8H4K409_9HYPO|nr:hypothetical protein F53441_11615 [Fusarium austroafricanum]
MDALHVRLVSPIGRPVESTKYVALSHCWGKVEAIKLLANNVGQFQNGIHIQDLPNSYQEAVRLCLSMGFTYIWIDSLCIIQDSLEDWEREAKDMKRVYEHAIFNLCSATASDSSGTSFISRHANLLKPQRIKVQGEVLQLISNSLFKDDITYCTLRSRAWVYQEWYLSKRSLILGTHQLWWRCRRKLACEIRPLGVPEAPGLEWWTTAQNFKESETSIDKLSSMDAWNERVRDYMGTKLTRESDRMIAFSGIVQSFGKSRKISQEYLAGLWRCNLPAALLWYTLSSARRSATYSAASWSWASLAGHCQLTAGLNLLQEPCYLSIEHIGPLCKRGIYGFSLGGVIIISGFLFEVKYRDVDPSSSKCVFMDPSDPDIDGQLFWDEKSESEQFVSHLNAPNTDNFDQWLEQKAIRLITRIQEAQGNFHFLLSLDQGEMYHYRFRGLILYEPEDQPGLFYRVGYMNWQRLPKGLLVHELPFRQEKRRISLL